MDRDAMRRVFVDKINQMSDAQLMETYAFACNLMREHEASSSSGAGAEQQPAAPNPDAHARYLEELLGMEEPHEFP